MLRVLLFLLWIATPALAYQVIFEGFPSEEIALTGESLAILSSEINRPPPTLFTLKKRAESDRGRLIDLLHAYGYYSARVELHYLGSFPDLLIRVEIDPGPVYLFDSPKIIDDQGGALLLPTSLRAGCPAQSEVILHAGEEILEELSKEGYPLARVIDRLVVVDPERCGVEVTYSIDLGPLSPFGCISIEGLRKVQPGFVRRRILWSMGELYNPNSVVCTETYLQESGLFSLVLVKPGTALDEEGLLPMQIRLEEKKYRHVGAGVSYSTDESAGVMAQWSHDNLTGWGDALALTGEYSKIIKRATGIYGRPDFFGRDQDLLLRLEARREDTPGFTEREVSFLVRISRRIGDCFSYNYGGMYERLLSTKSDNDENYNLLSLPFQARWDTSNRLLDPTHGVTLAYFFFPYLAVINQHISFFKQELYGITYMPLLPRGHALLALSGQFGSILGQSRELIPAPKRFYAGSSTSLRGYKYLSVSPLGPNGRKPIGGRSLMIFSVEPQLRVWGKLYLASFYDIGNVYSTPFPQLNKKLLRSTGVGLRYLTPVGPFRLDIAFPLDKRKGIDKTFQIYATIGPTF